MRVVSKHHFLPHIHEDGKYHRAHAISLVALFIYLQALIFVSGGFYFFRANTGRVLGTSIYSPEQIIFLTNRERAEEGLPALAVNPLLSGAAKAKADDMFNYNYWAHNSPSGRTPWFFISEKNYKYLYAGENLARDFDKPEEVVRAWMNSPTHKTNILDKNFREIGVAVVPGKLLGREGVLVVQLFGATSSAQLAGDFKGESTTSLAQVSEGEKPVAIFKSFSLAKSVSLSLVGFIFALFIVETVIVTRKTNMSLSAAVVAHLMLLGFVLFALWYSVSGTIV